MGELEERYRTYWRWRRVYRAAAILFFPLFLIVVGVISKLFWTGWPAEMKSKWTGALFLIGLVGLVVAASRLRCPRCGKTETDNRNIFMSFFCARCGLRPSDRPS